MPTAIAKSSVCAAVVASIASHSVMCRAEIGIPDAGVQSVGKKTTAYALRDLRLHRIMLETVKGLVEGLTEPSVNIRVDESGRANWLSHSECQLVGTMVGMHSR